MIRKKIKSFFILLLIAISCYPLYPQKTVTLKEIFKPSVISVSSSRIYIVQKNSIYIYSREDYKFIKIFGRKGEGPGEYRGIMKLITTPEHVIVSGYRKMHFFSADGKYLRQIKSMVWSFGGIIPFGRKFVCVARIEEDKKSYNIFKLINPDLKSSQELYRYQGLFDTPGGFNPIEAYGEFYTSKKMILIKAVDDKIYCFNENGKKIRTITLDTRPVKVTNTFAENYKSYLKNHKKLNVIYKMYKNMFEFPDHFPLIRYMRVADEKIYVITRHQKNQEHECIVLNLEGIVLRKVFLPFHFKSIGSEWPFDIKNDTLYQAVEDEGDEAIKLHITEIK